MVLTDKDALIFAQQYVANIVEDFGSHRVAASIGDEFPDLEELCDWADNNVSGGIVDALRVSLQIIRNLKEKEEAVE